MKNSYTSLLKASCVIVHFLGGSPEYSYGNARAISANGVLLYKSLTPLPPFPQQLTNTIRQEGIGHFSLWKASSVVPMAIGITADTAPPINVLSILEVAA